MSQINKRGFREFAKEVHPATILLPLAWIVFVAGQAIAQGTISLMHLGIGGLCCLLVFNKSRWGRLFCAMYNVLLVISIYLQGKDLMAWPLMDVISTLLFTGATITLFIPKTFVIPGGKRKILSNET
ncbi:hypothetical protein [Desulforhopalus sp. IMCC35007]|uniref:hypothetical protein n=1 Tax=Desulforhopalus sp. IMCC35007 TaxID=2569543 RepID=UPI0010ADEAC3|nr:hypothetical protein [Desulforhopalus sp. IMCC35007]TKB05847.1 hypothetical protein FCL48_23275 [Desulforhopalus sp. IMCC35007]